MTSDDELMREIEDGEQWLRWRCAPPDTLDTDRIKDRVRVALHERWLASRLCDRMPANFVDRTKRLVRSSLAKRQHMEQSATPTRGSVRGVLRWSRWVGGAGLAAAACLLALVGPFRSQPVQDNLPLVDAFEEFVDDEFSQSLDLIEDDLRNLEFALGRSPGRGEEDDAMFDDLLDAIEGAIWESKLGDDWS